MGRPSSTLRADAVVIGSGAGGAPVAARLAEAGAQVVLLEAGPRLETSELTGDEGEMTRRLYTLAQAAGSGLSIYAGQCVGGSTLINDALCWRTPPEVLAAWREEHGLAELTDAAFEPFLDEAWGDLGATPTDRAHVNRNAHALAVGAARLGWANEAMPRSVRGCANLGLCNFGCPSGAKQSTLRTYMPRAERAGAQVVADARVERIELASGAVRAVEATLVDTLSRRPKGALRVEAPLVVVAAGVLGTAPLLLRSGIAGRVGGGVQVHTSLHVTARFAQPVHAYYGPTMAWAVTQFSDVHGHAGPGYMIENTAVHPVSTASALPGFGREHESRMARLPFLARALVVLRDRARGRITLDGDGGGALALTLEPDDRRRLHDGMLAIARLYLAAGAREVILPIDGSAPIRSASELDAMAGGSLDPRAASLLYAVHLFGGAAMGGDASGAPCDAFGRVRGVRGLVVSDAASLPSNTGVNPQVTVVANALRIGAALARGAGA